MKSCLGILLVFFTFVTVIGGGALIWYLSSTAEFSRKDVVKTPSAPLRAEPANRTPPPPRATPVQPPQAPRPAPKPAPQPSSPFGSKEPN